MASYSPALALENRELVIQQLNSQGPVLNIDISSLGALAEPQRSLATLAKVCHQIRAEAIVFLCEHRALAIRLEHLWEDPKLKPLKELHRRFLTNMKELYVSNYYAYGS